MTEIITLRHLCKRYRSSNGTLALDDVSLTIHGGEIFSLLGPNGAGKTTLIAILCGLFPPTSGEAIVAGRDVVRDPLGVKQQLGVVPEEVALYPQLTARQNLHYFGQLYGLMGRTLAQAVGETLALVGLAERGDEKVGRYSSGMKRRLNIGVGLLHRPAVLLMDEPTVGLDPESRRHILDLVRRLKQERGTTILYTTHYMDEAEAISDRVGIIHRGRLVAVDTPEALIRSVQAGEIVQLQLDVATLPSAALDALRQTPGINQATVDGNVIRLAVSRSDEVLPAILHVKERYGWNVRTLTVSRPRLEDVFLQLTGEAFERMP